MDDSNNTSHLTGSQQNRVTDQSTSSRSLPNDETLRSGDRTCTQKLSIPSLEKYDSSSANLWWRKFVQYIKMTKDIDLSIMTNSKEILPKYREQLELEIKDTFLWAIGQSALTEMTKTVREREPSILPLHKLYTLIRLHFTPERNVQHSRADFFDIKRETNETAADVWKRILDVEKKCECETITAAELIASKFLSLIGKSTGDYEFKKKIRKSDKSIEAITDAIHEYMYEKLNESPESEKEKIIRHVDERKLTKNKEQTERYSKTRRLDCNKCGAPNWSKQHECPARGKKCAKCGKLGHYAKCCRSMRKVNHIADEETESANEDDWIPEKIHSIQQKINSMGTTNKNGIPFYTRTLLVNNRPIKFIVDTDSPVTLIPKLKFNRITDIKPALEDYRDVNDNKMKFEGKTVANIEIDGEVKQLELLITTKQTHPLLGLNWMKELGLTLKTETTHQSINNINRPDRSNNRVDADIATLKGKFHKHFTENHTVENVEVDIQLKEGSKLIQQKRIPIPIHLQPAVEKEVE